MNCCCTRAFAAAGGSSADWTSGERAIHQPVATATTSDATDVPSHHQRARYTAAGQSMAAKRATIRQDGTCAPVTADLARQARARRDFPQATVHATTDALLADPSRLDLVVVAAPVKQGALNIVMGVNDNLYDAKLHDIVTAATCTTNCLAPVVGLLQPPRCPDPTGCNCCKLRGWDVRA